MASVKITNRPPEYDAIQYTGTNEAEVEAFVGFLFKPSTETKPPRIYDPVAQYLIPLVPNCWVVMTGFAITVLDPAAFAKQYVVVTS